LTACRSNTGPSAWLAALSAERGTGYARGYAALIAKIQALPAERIAKVEDFVDFIATKTRRLAALDRLLAIAPALEAAGASPMTEAEIAAEVEAVCAARRSRAAGAD
jgi:hypothetical protein